MQTITMKRQTFIIISLGVITALLTSCDPRETMFETFGEEQGLQTYTLYLDADVPSFESGHEGETRASDSSWEDGDVIYVSFSNGGSTKVCNATYKSTLGAFQFSAISLNAINDASCSVYYFRGGDVSFSNNTVTMDKYTAIFTDTNAKYTCTNNTITLSASLKPYTWRLCFRGGRGTDIKINSTSNILYNTTLNLSNGDFTTTTDNINLQVQSDGYTPYIYGRFSITGNQINVEVGSSSFSRSIESSKLDIGKSGYFSIPTSSDLNGWRMITAYNGHEYVDLGLPSGTLWATCNIGASVPEEYGGYYAWGEIEEKEYYNQSRYFDGTCPYIGTDIANTKYDVVNMKWEGLWQMPSITHFTELFDNCSRERTSQNGVNGILFTGPNDASIFLPAAGVFLYGGVSYNESNGNYLMSTLSLETGSAADCFLFDSGDWSLGYLGYEGRWWGCTVRPIISNKNENTKTYCPDEQHPHMIDLGLPSGSRWSCCNIGASSPEEHGKYYAWGETAEKEFYDRSSYFGGTYPYWGDDIAGTEYDVAHMMWGDLWKIPCKDQFEELMNNCSREWSVQNGVKGVLVTGPNGATIFFPESHSINEYGGGYWSSTINQFSIKEAESFGFNSLEWSLNGSMRHNACSVRPVKTLEIICCPDHFHPHLIDLDLPSGTKWACCNIGASAPDENGGYYSWGETEEKDIYSYETYQYYSDNRYVNIGDDIAGTQYDVAYIKWGDSWRMPSIEQIRELKTYCKWTWMSPVNGYFVVGMNGNKIFLPAAGYDNEQFDWGPSGYYWSSTLCNWSSIGGSAYILFFPFLEGDNDRDRVLGLSVRAVRP